MFYALLGILGLKIAIKIDRIYFDGKSGIVELSILDTDMIEDIKLKLRTNQMTTCNVKKEWVEIGDSNV